MIMIIVMILIMITIIYNDNNDNTIYTLQKNNDVGVTTRFVDSSLHFWA